MTGTISEETGDPLFFPAPRRCPFSAPAEYTEFRDTGEPEGVRLTRAADAGRDPAFHGCLPGWPVSVGGGRNRLAEHGADRGVDHFLVRCAQFGGV